jgi:hypothetical protein
MVVASGASVVGLGRGILTSHDFALTPALEKTLVTICT